MVSTSSTFIFLRNQLRRILATFNLAITSAENYQSLINAGQFAGSFKRDLDLILEYPEQLVKQAVSVLPFSKSQLRQDIFVLLQSNFKRGGFFVEFGATNGVDLSNTYLLEKNFEWEGIVAEPARSYRPYLVQNRNCHISFDALWSFSGKVLPFLELQDGVYSRLKDEIDHNDSVLSSLTYEVKTTSLIDLLSRFNAPNHIDYLSIDTEGSELQILSTFDFEKYSFGCITIEHNYSPNRDQIFNLLTEAGYLRVSTRFSEFDDWYIKSGPKS